MISSETAKPYSLLDDRVDSGKLPGLDMLVDGHLGDVRKAFFSILRSFPDIERLPAYKSRFSDIPGTQDNVFCIVSAETFEGKALISFPATLVSVATSLLFGGSHKIFTHSLHNESVMFGYVSERIAAAFLEGFLERMKDGAPFEAERIETRRDFLFDVAQPSDYVCSVPFRMEFSGMNFDIHLRFPYLFLGDRLKTLEKDISIDGAFDMKASSVMKTVVRVSAVLGTADAFVGDVENLRVGDIIPLKGIPFLSCDGVCLADIRPVEGGNSVVIEITHEQSQRRIP